MIDPPRLLLPLAMLVATTVLPAQVTATAAVLTVATPPGTLVIVTMSLEATEPIVGFSLGLTHDASVLTPVGVGPGNAFAGTASNFFPNLAPAGGIGVTVGVLIDGDLVPPFATLSAGVAHSVVEVTYFVANSAPLGPSALEFTDVLGDPPVAMLVVTDDGVNNLVESPIAGSLGAIEITEAAFRRGDCNFDGGVTILDALRCLEMIFLPTSGVDCMDVTDVNDNGFLGVDDAVYLLHYLFTGAVGPPPAPFPNCGTDPTADSILCTEVLGSC